MRRVLRLRDTGRFVKGAGIDTAHFENGQPFSGFSDALIFCVDQELEGVELVLLDENGEEQICLRIT
jgi:hypothetical protein